MAMDGKVIASMRLAGVKYGTPKSEVYLLIPMYDIVTAYSV